MFSITKIFGPFSAAHHLTGVAPGHQCGENHGHNYMIEVVLEGPQLNDEGFLVDYGDLKVFEEYAKSRMDHKDLNEQFSFSPTAENLALHFFEWIEGTTDWPVAVVRVSETPGKTMSEYRRDPEPRQLVNVNINTTLSSSMVSLAVARSARCRDF